MKPINLRIAEELGVREQQVAASRRASATAHRERGLARHDGQLYLVPAHQNGCFAGLPGSTPPALAAPRERPTPSSSLRLSHGPARYPEPDSVTDRGRVQQDVILGLLCGAIIGLFFGYISKATPEAGLGLSALALLAGYNVSSVFAFLDELSNRIFQPGQGGHSDSRPA